MLNFMLGQVLYLLKSDVGKCGKKAKKKNVFGLFLKKGNVNEA